MMTNNKKVVVTLNEAQVAYLESFDELGTTNAEKLRSALIVYISTRGLTNVLNREVK